MFALLISKPRFKSIILFYQNSPKMKLFLQKNAKFLSAGASPPDPHWPPAADPQNSPPPIANFWLSACLFSYTICATKL